MKIMKNRWKKGTTIRVSERRDPSPLLCLRILNKNVAFESRTDVCRPVFFPLLLPFYFFKRFSLKLRVYGANKRKKKKKRKITGKLYKVTRFSVDF